MKSEYIITNQELCAMKLDLNDYALDGSYVEAIIIMALNKGITEILHLNDNFLYEEDIEKALDKDNKLVKAFKKLQYQIIYNLIFLGDNEPIDSNVVNIICCDLRWGKINGFQKNIYVRG